MDIIVQKFGGGVIRDIKSLNRAADIITQTVSKNTNVVAVVSAMGNTTESLLKLANTVNPTPSGREMDMLLTIGERITMSLLSLALAKRGYDAVSFTGSQVGIITDNIHTDARIVEIRGIRLKEALKNSRIPIVAGFQGVSQNKEITTLGRGGSDVTAVAVAAYLNAKQCELYKDVGGIKTENPADFTNLKHIYNITYGEILELTSAGAEVIHPRACALAYKYNIPILIKSFNRKGLSTMIKTDCSNNKNKTEKAFVRAIAHSDDLCRLSLIAVPQLSKCLHQVIVRFAEAHIPLILFSHGIPYHKKFDLSFIVKKAHFKKAKTVLDNAMKIVNAENLAVADNLASISLIGPGISSDVEIFSALFETLHQMSLHIDAFSSSETRITCFLNKKDAKKAVLALLKKFDLINKK